MMYKNIYLPRLDDAKYIVAGAPRASVIMYIRTINQSNPTDCLWFIPGTSIDD